jgi:signal transduction histidine kinase
MRALIADLLSREFRVRLARDGQEGLERFREAAPDLVVSDVMMPRMTGTEFCKILKADPVSAAVPFVLVTSKAEREMKIEGLELGAEDYVAKPFHPRELLARVRSLVRLKRLREELALRNDELSASNRELEQAISDLREAEVQLVQSERLAAIGELVAGVAHEVNNPVNFARNALLALREQVHELLDYCAKLGSPPSADAGSLAQWTREIAELRERLGVAELSESVGELVDIVREGLDRTHRLVGDLRDVAARGNAPQGPVDVAACIASTVRLVRSNIEKSGIVLRESVAPELPPVQGDSGALGQVFLNLLKNAAEAIGERGGEIEVSAERAGDELVIRVRDDGPGIPPEVRARLFEPFFTTKAAGKGTGLGLSICRRVAGEHAGTIEVESEVGKGSVFELRLPAQREDSAS